MLVVFLPIFVADTKIIFRYDFVAPLSIYEWKNGKVQIFKTLFTFTSSKSYITLEVTQNKKKMVKKTLIIIILSGQLYHLGLLEIIVVARVTFYGAEV